jgi:hypothetical protein
MGYFFKADLSIDPAPMTTKILDIQRFFEH